MLELQKFLRSGGTLEQLKDRFFILSKRHQIYNNLILFKYIKHNDLVPFHEQLVRECRGIILDENDNWRVVCRSMDKFFNHGENLAATVDWNTASVLEKADGSLCQLYHYDDKWHIATSGTPDGMTAVGDFGTTFKDYFWDTFHSLVPNASVVLKYLPENLCFYFELTGIINRVVVKYDKPNLTLIGARTLLDNSYVETKGLEPYKELTAIRAADYFDGYIRPVRSFLITSMPSLMNKLEDINPFEQEGFIVVDSNFNRVKVKSPKYIQLHHLRDGISVRSFVNVVRSGEISEALIAFPEYTEMMNDVSSKFNYLVDAVNKEYDLIKDVDKQKDFAIKAVKTKCPAALFSVRANKVDSVLEFFKNLQIDNLMQLMGLKSNEIKSHTVES